MANHEADIFLSDAGKYFPSIETGRSHLLTTLPGNQTVLQETPIPKDRRSDQEVDVSTQQAELWVEFPFRNLSKREKCVFSALLCEMLYKKSSE